MYIFWLIHETGSGNKGNLPSEKLKLVDLQKLKWMWYFWVISGDISIAKCVFQKTTNFVRSSHHQMRMICIFFMKSCPPTQQEHELRNFFKKWWVKETATITGNKSNCLFLDQYNSSENGRNHYQKSKFWNWNFSMKITFVFNSVSYDALYTSNLVTQGSGSVENVIKLGYYLWLHLAFLVSWTKSWNTF